MKERNDGKNCSFLRFVYSSALLMSGVKPGQQSGGAGLWVAFGRTKRGFFGIAIGLGVSYLFSFLQLLCRL